MPESRSAASAITVFRQFVAAINQQNVAAIAELLTQDHLFVDALGNTVRDAGSMETGWRGYFTMCPDYSIRVDYVMSDGQTVLAAGEAGGTIDATAWRTPAAWKAVVSEGAVAEWRVFADNKPVYEILAKRQR